MNKKNIRSTVNISIFLGITAVLFLSCAKKMQGTADNDIITLTPVNQKKTLITVRAEFNTNLSYMEQAIEHRFPDIDIVFRFHCARETQYELYRSLESGTAEDIIISPNMLSISSIAGKTLLDLSGESFIDSYNGQLLNSCLINGHIYFLPGPSDTYGIVYDKTMFAQHGWKVPQCYSEFISLCRKIKTAGIKPIQPSFKYARQAQLAFTMFCYDSVFGGIANTEWLEKYQNGNAKMKEHLLPAFNRYRELYNEGIISLEDFEIEPGNRSSMLYSDHSCAMIFENQMAQVYAKQFNSDHEYAMMPFFCGDNSENAHLVAVSNYYIGINKKLSEKQNRKKLAKALAVLNYISTPEGQIETARGHVILPPPLTGMTAESNGFNEIVQNTIRNGGLSAETNLIATGNNNAVEKTLQSGLCQFLKGKMSAEQVMDLCDKTRDYTLSSDYNRGEIVGYANKDFTNLETAQFIARVFKDKTGADFGLCIAGQTSCGTHSRIYKGTLYSKDIQTLELSLGSRNNNPDDKKLWVISLTGKQLLDLLAKPYMNCTHTEEYREPYFTADGLEITFAPWADAAQKLVSVTLPGGSPLDLEKTYTAALWCWPDFSKSCPYKIERIYNDTFESIILEGIKNSRNAISPENNNSMKLLWYIK